MSAGTFRRDRTGERNGRLVFIAWAGLHPTDHASRWLARCDCGTERVVEPRALSCGCLGREKSADRQRRHGFCGTRTYITWQSMLRRCLDPKQGSYRQYGARGVTVCQRWMDSFENFLEDMGERPLAKSLDRLDNSRGYEPGNCRWATSQEQNENRATVRHIHVEGTTRTLAGWSRVLGIHPRTLSRRIARGEALGQSAPQVIMSMRSTT